MRDKTKLILMVALVERAIATRGISADSAGSLNCGEQ